MLHLLFSSGSLFMMNVYIAKLAAILTHIKHTYMCSVTRLDERTHCLEKFTFIPPLSNTHTHTCFPIIPPPLSLYKQVTSCAVPGLK